jgi:transcriptional regulator GlxA family with amidase domain
MQIAILIFDGLTALDAIGPYEVLSRLPGAELRFVAKQAGPKRTDTGALGVQADLALADLANPEVVLVPGGTGNRALMSDHEVLEWLRGAHGGSTWTTSVCTGALVLGAAGILDGKRATTHWAFVDRLPEFGAEPVAQRVVEDGKVITAAGVSAGIDMALTLASRVAGDQVAQAIQLGIEYDPDPPFDAGSPAKASPEAIELIRAMERGQSS